MTSSPMQKFVRKLKSDKKTEKNCLKENSDFSLNLDFRYLDKLSIKFFTYNLCS